MRIVRILGLIAVACSLLVLTSGAQKTAPNQRQIPQFPQTQPKDQNQRQVPPAQLQERNKVPVRQLYEDLFSQGRYEKIDQVFARGCPVHFGGRHVGLEQAVAEGKGWRSAAPDLRMIVNDISVNGDMVNVMWTAIGTHTGQAPGLKPTGKRINMRGRSQFRVVNGKIVEAWNEEYRPELFRQLGVSKTQAMMFFAAEGLWAAADPIIPDRFYAALR